MNIHTPHLALPELGRWLATVKPKAHTAVAVVLEWTATKAPIWLTEPNQLNIILGFLSDALGPEADSTTLFILPNGSLVLAAEAMGHKAYHAADACLQRVMREMVPHQPDATVTAYDLSIHWDTFFTACQRIYHHQLAAPEKKDNRAFLEAMLRSIRRDFPGVINTSNSLNLLFVEDDPATRQLITHLIADQNARLFFASTGAEAITAYCAHLPHMVFLDIELPDISGLDILGLLTKHDPASYVVMLTGNAQQRNVEFALQQGIKGFITKPFNRQKLLDCIARFRKSSPQ